MSKLSLLKTAGFNQMYDEIIFQIEKDTGAQQIREASREIRILKKLIDEEEELLDYLKTRQLVLEKSISAIIVNLIVGIFSLVITTDIFYEYVSSHLNTSAGFLTRGRSTILKPVYDLVINDFLPVLHGIGQGEILIIIENKLGYHTLLHNDVLKLLIEHGILVFSLFFAFLYSKQLKSIFVVLYLLI
jgi:hypothetical protein